MPTEKHYRADIDGLRAIAVLSVLLFHLDITVFSGGFVGVDVFFVISGFLITRLIVEEIKSTNDFSFINFYIRRARRLLPAFLTVLIITTAIAVLLFSPHDLENFGASAFHSIFSISNIYFWREAGYFDAGIKLNPLLHTWSLGVEEQFYLVWPFVVLFFATRFGINSIIKVLIFVIISSLILNLAFDDSVVFYFSPNTTNQNLESIRAAMFYIGPFRNFELGIGALLVFFMHKRLGNNLINELLFLIGLAFVIVPFFVFDEQTTFPSYNALLPCFGTAMVIFANNPKYSGQILTNPLAVGIGLISYSLYLVHWPLIALYKYWTLQNLTSTEQLCIGVISILLAYSLYRFVEQKWRKPRDKEKTTNAVFLVSIGTICVLLTLATSNMWAQNGWLWRLDDDRKKLFRTISGADDFHLKYYGGVNCEPYNSCSVNKEQETNIYFIGDSHSQQYAYGFANIFPEYKFTHFDNRCRYNTIYHCYGGKSARLKYFSNKKKDLNVIRKIDDLVVISQYWGSKARHYNTKANKYVSFENTEQYVRFLTKELVKLEKYLGKGRVLIIGQVNRFGQIGNPLTCIGRPLSDKKCQFTPNTDAVSFNALMEQSLTEVSIPFINPTKKMCSDGQCTNFNSDGKPLYSDPGHLSIWGSEYVVSSFKEDFASFFGKSKSK